MTVRERTGRRRYIVFEISGYTDSPSDGDDSGGNPEAHPPEVIDHDTVLRTILHSIRDRGIDRQAMRFRLIFYGKGIGIVRCLHPYKDRMIELLNGIEIHGSKMNTLKTSGTLKTLRDWLRDKRGVTVPGKTKPHLRRRKQAGPAGDESIK